MIKNSQYFNLINSDSIPEFELKFYDNETFNFYMNLSYHLNNSNYTVTKKQDDLNNNHTYIHIPNPHDLKGFMYVLKPYDSGDCIGLMCTKTYAVLTMPRIYYDNFISNKIFITI